MLLDLSMTSSTLAALKLASTEVTPHSSRPSKRSQPSTWGPSNWPAAPAIGAPASGFVLPPLPTFRSTTGAVPPARPVVFSPAAPSSLPLHAPISASKDAENPTNKARFMALTGRTDEPSVVGWHAALALVLDVGDGALGARTVRGRR